MSHPVLLFDLDGTLVDSAADLAAAVNRLRGELGLSPLEVAEVCAMVGDGAALLVRRALPEGAFRPGLLSRFLQFYREGLLERTVPYAGIPEFLMGRAPDSLAVVTNKPQPLAEELLAGLGLRERFGAVVGGSEDLPRKPRPEPLLRALESLGASPAAAVMVGDHHVDLEAGRAAGVATCFCAWGFGRDGGLPHDFRAETPGDLQRLFPR